MQVLEGADSPNHCVKYVTIKRMCCMHHYYLLDQYPSPFLPLLFTGFLRVATQTSTVVVWFCIGCLPFSRLHHYFRPQPQKSSFTKARNNINLVCGKTGIEEPNALSSSPISQPDQRSCSSQTKPRALLGSSKSISDYDVVSETVEDGYFRFWPRLTVAGVVLNLKVLLLPRIKGRLRAHCNFWSQI